VVFGDFVLFGVYGLCDIWGFEIFYSLVFIIFVVFGVMDSIFSEIYGFLWSLGLWDNVIFGVNSFCGLWGLWSLWSLGL
jgi:hypothetical protein